MKAHLFILLLATTPALAQKPAHLKLPKHDANEIFVAVQQPAVPEGGPVAYADYLEKNQEYPTAALKAGQEGVVQVTFVVEKNGSISDVAVTQPVAPLLDAEAVRLIKAGPRWTPAHHRGELARQRVLVPVAFVVAPGSGEVVSLPTPGDGGSATAALPPGAVAAAPGTSSIVGTTAKGISIIRPEKVAQPVGGTAAFFAWIQANQHYPALARKRGIEAKVPIEFMVQPDGSITNVRVVQKHGSGLDEEAVRLIMAAPKWEPAVAQGRPIKQKMALPVVFQL